MPDILGVYAHVGGHGVQGLDLGSDGSRSN